MNPDLNFLSRKIMMAVPLSFDMRKSFKCVHYTALPRDVEEENERIQDPKNAVSAKEAEVRVPDGTAVPPDSAFVVKTGTTTDRVVVRVLAGRYNVIR